VKKSSLEFRPPDGPGGQHVGLASWLPIGAFVAAAGAAPAAWAQTTFADQIPHPPVNQLVPHGPIVLFGLFNLAMFVLVVGLLCREAWRTRSVLPFAFLVGCGLAAFAEPIFDGNIHVWFAEMQKPDWRFYNVGYPWFEIPGNALMGGPTYWMYHKFQKGMSNRELWIWFVVWYLFDVIWEIPGTVMSSYVYYGPHPFTLFGYPLWIGMMCGLGLPLVGFVAYAMRNSMSAGRLWWMIVVLAPVTIYGCEVITWPMWITLNGGQTVAVAQAAALLSLVFTLCGYYAMTAIYQRMRTAFAAESPAELVPERSVAA
jgi:hypothetical protein